MIFYGVQDRGIQQGAAVLKAPGYSITGTGKIEFGKGWVARGSVDYLSSYLFHQQFTDSFTQAVISEAQSSGYLEKHFGPYTFDASATRTENFLDTVPGDSVEVRSLPEVELNNNYQPLTGGPLPLYYSLHADVGLFHRVQPRPLGQPAPYYYSTSQFSARAELEPSIATAFHFGGFTLLPEATLHERYYTQTISNYVISNTNLAAVRAGRQAGSHLSLHRANLQQKDRFRRQVEACDGAARPLRLRNRHLRFQQHSALRSHRSAHQYARNGVRPDESNLREARQHRHGNFLVGCERQILF